MRIEAIAIGDESCGSARLRCHRPARLAPSGFRWKLASKGDVSFDCDVLYVQKIAEPWVVEAASKAVAEGVPVVYDIDDDFGVWPGMDEAAMVELASRVTVDTEGRKALLGCDPSKVRVVPPGVDYMDHAPPPLEASGGVSGIVTFGSNHSVVASRGWMDAAEVGEKTHIASIQLIPGKWVSWDLGTFVDELRSCDVCLLVHGDGADRRCANRLLAAMAAGVPTVTSDSMAYRRVLDSIGLGWLVARGPEWLAAPLRRLADPEMRMEVSRTFMEHAWGRHHPRVQAEALARVLAEVGPPDSRRTLRRLVADPVVNRHSYQMAHVEAMYREVREGRPRAGVEFGVGRGLTSIAMALGMKDNGMGRMVSYDTFELDPEEGRQSLGIPFGEASLNMERYGVDDIVTLARGDVRKWMGEPQPFQLLHVDIDNDGEKIRSIWSAVRPMLDFGGAMLFEGGKRARDEVGWMRAGGHVGMADVQEETGYTLADETKWGLGRIGAGARRLGGAPKRVLVVIDEYGWAFEFFARGWSAHSRHEVSFVRHDEFDPPTAYAENDVVVVMTTLLASLYLGEKVERLIPARTILGVRSALGWELADPADFAALVANSKVAHDMILRKWPRALNVCYSRGAVDDSIFTPGPLGDKVGWSGNPRQPVKRVHLLDGIARRWGGVSRKSDWGERFFKRGRSREDQLAWLRSLRCFVQLSSSEGMSQALMEAVACGVPVVATDAGDTAQLVAEPWVVPVEPESGCVERVNDLVDGIMADDDVAATAAAENLRRFREGGWGWSSRASDMDVLVDGVTTEPLVSVVVPCWKQAEYLERSVGSALAQTVPVEVVIVDDGSPDDCAEVATRLARANIGRVRLVRQENTGLPGARNAGIGAARASYVFPLDADDELGSRDVLARAFGVLMRGFDVAGVDLVRASDGSVLRAEMDEGRIARENCVPACAMYRKSLWERVGGYKKEMRGGYEDWEMWVSVLEAGGTFGRAEGVHVDYDDAHPGRMSPEARTSRGYWRLVAEMDKLHPGFFQPEQPAAGVSVILSSYNQAGKLPLALEALRGQGVAPLEVVVADDGSTDGTLEWLDEQEDAAWPFRLRYVTREHSWYRLASANNLAAARAKGSRLLFTNADQVHCPGSVGAHSGLSGNVVGAGMFKGVDASRSGLVDLGMVRRFGEVERLARDHPSRKTNEGYVGKVDPNRNPIGVWGGNFSVPAGVFRDVGGYDAAFDVGWGGEENDLVGRCVRAGATVSWVARSVIYHLDHPARAYARAQLGSGLYGRKTSG